MSSPPRRNNKTAKVLASLRHTRKELREGKRLLEDSKKRAKKAKGRLARENAKRFAKLIDKTVDSLEDHQDMLIDKVAGPTGIGRSPTRRKSCPRSRSANIREAPEKRSKAKCTATSAVRPKAAAVARAAK
jgi:hypothetical protein